MTEPCKHPPLYRHSEDVAECGYRMDVFRCRTCNQAVGAFPADMSDTISQLAYEVEMLRKERIQAKKPPR